MTVARAHIARYCLMIGFLLTLTGSNGPFMEDIVVRQLSTPDHCNHADSKARNYKNDGNTVRLR